MNHHEHQARERKARRLVAQVWGFAAIVGIDPARDAISLAELVEGFAEIEWAALADAAGVLLPSETTRAMVVAMLAERAPTEPAPDSGVQQVQP